jgi:hypothetical protein
MTAVGGLAANRTEYHKDMNLRRSPGAVSSMPELVCEGYPWCPDWWRPLGQLIANSAHVHQYHPQYDEFDGVEEKVYVRDRHFSLPPVPAFDRRYTIHPSSRAFALATFQASANRT